LLQSLLPKHRHKTLLLFSWQEILFSRRATKLSLKEWQLHLT
jgi:hypothetical protein